MKWRTMANKSNTVKYGWKWERMSEKIKWALSLPLKERYTYALTMSELVSKLYPKRRKTDDTHPTFGNIQILKKKNINHKGTKVTKNETRRRIIKYQENTIKE